ncbi:UNVERIFIED_CONTAM: putative aminopeptidase FrvX [Brevibacillus sp. OAP136]
MSSLKELMVQLDAIPGVSGDEELVATYIREQMTHLVDEHYADALGNQFFVKKGSHPELKLMLAAHMDEIGFIVQYIDEKGFVYVAPVGYHDSRMVINQILTIHTEKGPVKGITAAGAHSVFVKPEMAEKAIALKDLHLDLGTRNKQETLELGVKIGDYITYDRVGQFLNGGSVFTGKAVDDRCGCAVIIEVMKRLAERQVVPTIYAVTTVQEEVGIRGAGPAAFNVQPDVALAVDVALAGGMPGVEPRQMPIGFGEGPAIKFYDLVPQLTYGNNVPKKLTRRLVEVAEGNQIPYQREAMLSGGTDGWAISLTGKGAVTGCISLPSRYIHSATGCIHMDDLENAVKLILAFIDSLHEQL